MKRNKAVNVTKSDIKSNFRKEVTDHSYCYNKNIGNARTYIRHATIRQNQTGLKGFDFQYVSNRSHLTCSCENSGEKCQESSYFTAFPNQVHSKSFTDVGVGSVKALQRRKVKRIYLPETEERAVGTLDFLLCENPKCKHFTRFNEFYHRTSRKRDEKVILSNKIHFLDKKLSPLVQTKSNCTNPLSTHVLLNEINKGVDNISINKLISIPTLLGTKKLDKSPKIKIFKELSMNTESIETEQTEKSEVEISLERSKLLSNKNAVEFSSSLDSLVQHVYNLDRPCNGATSQVSVDPMENKLEREYRKIFSNPPRDCLCNNELSKTKSDSLLRRFDAFRHDVPGEKESKMSISKTSIEIMRDSMTIEPSYRDVSIESDPPSLRSPSNSNIKIVSPVPSNVYKKDQSKMAKKKNVTAPNVRKSSHWCSSDGEDHQGIKGMFKLWGKKLSLEDGCYKRSKFKCFDIKKRSDGSVKSNKLLKNKSRDRKEGKKFRFFKKKVKVPSRASKLKKDVMTGRCEVREGLKIKIGKSFLSQDQQAISAKKLNSKYDDMLLKSWLQEFVLRSAASTKNLTMKWDSSVFADCSNVTELKTNTSYDTDILLFSKSAIKNDTLRIECKKSLINFSKQYIQAWMIPKTILDRLVKTKIYLNTKGDKYNKKKHTDIGDVNDTKGLIHKEMLSADGKSVSESSTSMKGLSSECVMVNISLGCISEFNHQTYVHNQSIEKVYNVINYETPLSSSIKFSRNENEKQVPEDTNENEITISKNHNRENTVLNHDVQNEVLQDKLLDNTQTSRHNDAKDIKYPISVPESTNICKSLEGSLYLLPKNCKHAEIYLKKFFRTWIPLGLDLHLWCISDAKLHSACHVNNRDESFKSFPNVADQIRYTTLVASRDISVNKSDKSDLQDKYSYIKTIIKRNKCDVVPVSDLGIRIWAKDSLEVLKKRKLYSHSNRAKWNNDKDPSVSMSNPGKSKNHLLKFTSNKQPPRKRVTISEIEVKDSKLKLPVKTISRSENEIKKNKNVSYLTASQQASESLIDNGTLPKPKIKKGQGNAILHNLSTESDEPNSAEESDNCTPTTDTEENTKYLSPSKIAPPKTSEYPHLKHSDVSKSNNCETQIEKIVEKANGASSKSGFNFSDCLKPSVIKNKCNNLRQKFNSEKKGGSDESLKSDNKTKKCSITTDVQKISSLSKTFPVDDKIEETSKSEISKSLIDEKIEPEINRGKARMLGFHIKKPPIKKNMSTASSAFGEKKNSNINGNSVANLEKIIIINENKDVSKVIKEEIYRDDDNKKLERKSTSTNLDSKDSHLCIISVPGSMKKLYLDKDLNNEQQNEIKKESDFIEISFKIKRKQIDDRGIYVNINDSSDQGKKGTKKKLKGTKSSITNKSKSIFLVHNESKSSIVHENCRSCVDVKILLKIFKHSDFHKRSSHRNKFPLHSKRTSEKVQTVSSRLKKEVNRNLTSIPNFKIDSTDLLDQFQSNNEPIEYFEPFILKKMEVKSDKGEYSDEHRWINDKTDSNEITYSCRFKESNEDFAIKPVTDENENEKHSFSRESPSINYSFDNGKITNCKELKKRIIKKIVHCVKDLSKSKRKEKLRDVKRALRAVLLSDYSDKNIYVNNNEQLKRITSDLAKVSYAAYDFSNFDSAKGLKVQSNVNTNDYYYTVIMEENEHRKVYAQFISTDGERIEGQNSKTLATKSGVTDLRTCECETIISKDVNSSPLDKNKDRRPILNRIDLKENFVHHYSSNVSKYISNKNINGNDSFSKSSDSEATVSQRQVQQNRYSIKSNVVQVNDTLHSVDDVDGTLCSSFNKESLIIHQHCEVNNSNEYTKELADIFQLPEIKKAVFELYNASENLSNSDLLKTLPKFVNEVENVLFS